MRFKFALICLTLATIAVAQAALPPYAQNRRDLEVMIDFIYSHRLVGDTLNNISLDDYTVRYAETCVAQFTRKKEHMPRGWAGPSPALEFSSSNCDLAE